MVLLIRIRRKGRGGQNQWLAEIPQGISAPRHPGSGQGWSCKDNWTSVQAPGVFCHIAKATICSTMDSRQECVAGSGWAAEVTV